MTAKGSVTLRALAGLRCGVRDWGTDPCGYKSLLPDCCIPMALPEVAAYGFGSGG